MILLWLACAPELALEPAPELALEPVVVESPEPSPLCRLALAPAPGPLAKEVTLANGDLLTIARLRLREASQTGDAGFYTLAEAATDCLLERDPNSRDARWLKSYLLLQFHQFSEAEQMAQKLTTDETAHWQDWMLLGDARMEQGNLNGAEISYQKAVNLRPGVLLYDRIGWLRWLWGDGPGALEAAELAAQSVARSDPENFAWVLTRLGWLKILMKKGGEGELETALSILPDYPQAHYFRGRVRLAKGDSVGAINDFKKAGATVEALRALSEIPGSGIGDPEIRACRTQDPRGFALYLAKEFPMEALDLLNTERKSREDAMTLLAWAYAGRQMRSNEPAIMAKKALDTGILEPRARLLGALVLQDPRRLPPLEGPGLLPSEIKLGQELVGTTP